MNKYVIEDILVAKIKDKEAFLKTYKDKLPENEIDFIKGYIKALKDVYSITSGHNWIE